MNPHSENRALTHTCTYSYLRARVHVYVISIKCGRWQEQQQQRTMCIKHADRQQRVDTHTHTHKQTHVHVYTSTYLCVCVLTILCCCLISCFSLRCSCCCCCFCCCGRDYATYEHKVLDNWIKTFVAPLRSQFQENFLYTVTATAAAAAHSGNFCNFSWLLLLGFLLGWQMAQRRRHGIDNKTNTYIHIHNTITITTRQGMNA